MLGMGAAVLGMQATVGALVAKALTTSTVPYQAAPGQSPVLSIDVFLVQVLAYLLILPFGANHSLIKNCIQSGGAILLFFQHYPLHPL
jgi:hypothetical protein